MANKTAPINMRVEPSVRTLIDAAANLLKVDRSVFIQQAALAEAHKVIAAQRDFTLDEQAFLAFEQALDAEPTTNANMVELLARKAPWE